MRSVSLYASSSIWPKVGLLSVYAPFSSVHWATECSPETGILRSCSVLMTFAILRNTFSSSRAVMICLSNSSGTRYPPSDPGLVDRTLWTGALPRMMFRKSSL